MDIILGRPHIRQTLDGLHLIANPSVELDETFSSPLSSPTRLVDKRQEFYFLIFKVTKVSLDVFKRSVEFREIEKSNKQDELVIFR